MAKRRERGTEKRFQVGGEGKAKKREKVNNLKYIERRNIDRFRKKTVLFISVTLIPAI